MKISNATSFIFITLLSSILNGSCSSIGGEISLQQCDNNINNNNPLNAGDVLCVEFQLQSTGTGAFNINRIENLTLTQGSNTYNAIADGIIETPDLVTTECSEDGSVCQARMVLLESLFESDSEGLLSMTVEGAANFIVDFGAYDVSLEDNSVIHSWEDTLTIEGEIVVNRCNDATENLNPGEILCLQFEFVTESAGVGIDHIENLQLTQGTSTFNAIEDGTTQWPDLVTSTCDVTCETRTNMISSLFFTESENDVLSLVVSGNAYLYQGDSKEGVREQKGMNEFEISVDIEKHCEETAELQDVLVSYLRKAQTKEETQ